MNENEDALKEVRTSPWGVVLNDDGFVCLVTYNGQPIGRVRRASLSSSSEGMELPSLTLEILGPVNVTLDCK